MIEAEVQEKEHVAKDLQTPEAYAEAAIAQERAGDIKKAILSYIQALSASRDTSPNEEHIKGLVRCFPNSKISIESKMAGSCCLVWEYPVMEGGAASPRSTLILEYKEAYSGWLPSSGGLEELLDQSRLGYTTIDPALTGWSCADNDVHITYGDWE